MNIPEMILCNQVKILALLNNGLPNTPIGNSSIYTNDFIGEEYISLDSTNIKTFSVPVNADYCEVEIKGNGVVLRRLGQIPTLSNCNKFNQDDLILFTRAEMLSGKFLSTLTNQLYINYFRIIPKV